MDDRQEEGREKLVRDHLANERTFLAWIRTSIGVMAFGFVVERFAFLLHQATLLLGHPQATEVFETTALGGYSSIGGVLLIALGALISLLAFFKYMADTRAIEKGIYQPSPLLSIALTLLIVLSGISLVIYLSP